MESKAHRIVISKTFFSRLCLFYRLLNLGTSTNVKLWFMLIDVLITFKRCCIHITISYIINTKYSYRNY